MAKEFLGMKGRNATEPQENIWKQETLQKTNPEFNVDFNTGMMAYKSLKNSIQRCNA